ncbi:MAG: phosphotransferase [Pseudomonadota bacterium]|jgi:Putative homoserine kinase type II (protein kinase fold)
MSTSRTPPAAGDLLATGVSQLDAAEAERLAREHFGLVVKARPLTGERDSNVLITDADGRRFVLKLGNPAEEPEAIDFQMRALQHARSRDPFLPLPEPVPTLDGALMVEISGPDGTRILRVLSYLDGLPLPEAPRSAAQRRAIGALLARLDRALGDFAHPAGDQALLWDLQQAAKVRDLFVHLPPGRDHGLPRRFLDAFEDHALPVLPGLRRQVIHNDGNPHNLLVAPDAPDVVTGLIDFGDAVRAPLVQEVAVAAAYQLVDEGHPLAGAADVVAGYAQAMPLNEDELAVLFDLIAARLVLIVSIGGWRAARYPENAAYILRNNAAAWAGLQRIAALTRDEARTFLTAVARGEIP